MCTPFRSTILNLEPNGIGRVAFAGLGQPDVIPLWFGETDLVTPAFIRAAAKQALDDGHTFYDQARGKTALRQAIKAFHKRTLGTEVDIERISLPGAATLAVVTAMQCLIERGDNAVIVSPIWPSIFQAARVVGAELRFARLEEDWKASPPRWRLDLDKLFALCDARTKVIFVCSPGNPTGWMATETNTRPYWSSPASGISRSSATRFMERWSMTEANTRRRFCKLPVPRTICSSSTVSQKLGR